MGAGERIGDYVLERELGRGGMAHVFLARSVEGGPPVVLKRILPAIAGREDARNLFLREAKIATLLDHPNIVRVRELVQTDDDLALVMDYLEGLTLRDASQRAWKGGRSLPLEPLVQAMIESALALHHAHHLEVRGRELKLVHRDVSPDNLVITTSGLTKLIDFGVAKPDRGADLTVGGQLRGKPSYMAPEQVRDEKVDARADLWALGVSFYYLFTGKRPFKRDDAIGTMRAVLEETPPKVRELNPRLPRELESVIAGLMIKDRDRRTSTGAEVAAQLSAALRQVPRGYLPSGRILSTVDDAESSPTGKLPAHASLPSLDWAVGERKPDVDYDETRVVDLSVEGATYGGDRTRAPVVGALEVVEDEAPAEEDLDRLPTIIVQRPRRAEPESDPLGVAPTVVLNRSDFNVPETNPDASGGAALAQAPTRTMARPSSAALSPTVRVAALESDPPSVTTAIVRHEDEVVEEPVRRRSRSVALWVGIASFLLTIAVVAGLYFGGLLPPELVQRAEQLLNDAVDATSGALGTPGADAPAPDAPVTD
jgi:serine/threonine protein kinase